MFRKARDDIKHSLKNENQTEIENILLRDDLNNHVSSTRSFKALKKCLMLSVDHIMPHLSNPHCIGLLMREFEEYAILQYKTK